MNRAAFLVSLVFSVSCLAQYSPNVSYLTSLPSGLGVGVSIAGPNEAYQSIRPGMVGVAYAVQPITGGIMFVQPNLTNGTQKVGSLDLDQLNYHAMLYAGGGNTVDLSPSFTNYTDSYGDARSYSNAVGISQSGNTQVGWGSTSACSSNAANQPLGPFHAIMWNSTAESAIDLNPSFISGGESFAVATTDTQQVGYGNLLGWNPHAIVWNGSANSAIDLNPSFLAVSYADATNGNLQAGYGWGPNTNGVYHAILWMGSSASAIDLGQTVVLPGTTGPVDSEAFSIDANGNVFGYAEAVNSVTQQNDIYTVEWQADTIPEPSFIHTIIFSTACLLQRKRKTASM